LERHESASAAIAGQVDAPRATLANEAEHLIRPDEESAPLPLEQLARLITRQLAGAHEMVGERLRIGAHGRRCLLKYFPGLFRVEQLAVVQRAQEHLNAGRRIGSRRLRW